MDITIRCPNCETSLVVEDDLIGQSVLCEECNNPFTVPDQPARTSGRSKRRSNRPEPQDEAEPEFGYEFDDNRPIRHKPRARPNEFAPIVFGGTLLFVLLLIAVGFTYAFGFGCSFDNGSPPLPPGAKFRISNAGFVPNQGYTIKVETSDGNPPPRGFRIAWRSADERSFGNMTLTMPHPVHSVLVPIRNPRQSYSVWIESEPPINGEKQSNIITLN